MKKILIILLLLVASPCYAVNWCEDANTEACYTFEGTEANSLLDVSSNSRDLTNSGSTTYTTGYTGSGYDFNGTDNFLYVDTSPSVTHPVSLCGWFNADQTNETGVIVTIETKSNNADWFRATFKSGAVVGGDANADSGGGWQSVSTVATYSADTWTHTCTIFTDGNNRTAYINGGDSVTDTGSDGQPDSLERISIGVLTIPGSGTDGWLDGTLDEILVSSGALDSTDINDIMDNGLVQASTTPLAGDTLNIRGIIMKNIVVD